MHRIQCQHMGSIDETSCQWPRFLILRQERHATPSKIAVYVIVTHDFLKLCPQTYYMMFKFNMCVVRIIFHNDDMPVIEDESFAAPDEIG